MSVLELLAEGSPIRQLLSTDDYCFICSHPETESFAEELVQAKIYRDVAGIPVWIACKLHRHCLLEEMENGAA